MPFNAKETTVLNFKRPPARYTLFETNVKVDQLYKDLGLHVSHDLTWTLHITKQLSKANRIFFIVKRSIRLHFLKVLPLPLYMQMMDVIMFSKLCTAHYSINTTDVIRVKPSSSRHNTGFELFVPATTLEKTQQDFFLRTSRLPASLDVFNAEGLKSKLLSYIWSKFAEEFVETNYCTWIPFCRCPECRH